MQRTVIVLINVSLSLVLASFSAHGFRPGAPLNRLLGAGRADNLEENKQNGPDPIWNDFVKSQPVFFAILTNDVYHDKYDQSCGAFIIGPSLAVTSKACANKFMLTGGHPRLILNDGSSVEIKRECSADDYSIKPMLDGRYETKMDLSILTLKETALDYVSITKHQINDLDSCGLVSNATQVEEPYSSNTMPFRHRRCLNGDGNDLCRSRLSQQTLDSCKPIMGGGLVCDVADEQFLIGIVSIPPAGCYQSEENTVVNPAVAIEEMFKSGLLLECIDGFSPESK